MINSASRNCVNFSFGFLKPDCLQRNLVNVVYEMIENANLEVILKKRIQLDRNKAEAMYQEWRNDFFFKRAIEYICSGPIETFIVKGDDAIKRFENIVGRSHAQNVNMSQTIRGRYAFSRTHNFIHATSNVITLKREVVLIYSLEELQSCDGLLDIFNT